MTQEELNSLSETDLLKILENLNSMLRPDASRVVTECLKRLMADYAARKSEENY